jgi:hypothetical protein
MSDEERIKGVEEAIIIMKDLLVSHNERLENYFQALNESREDFNFKLNALIDTQIKNETEIQDLKEASKSQLYRIENLENK